MLPRKTVLRVPFCFRSSSAVRGGAQVPVPQMRQTRRKNLTHALRGVAVGGSARSLIALWQWPHVIMEQEAGNETGGEGRARHGRWRCDGRGAGAALRQ